MDKGKTAERPLSRKVRTGMLFIAFFACIMFAVILVMGFRLRKTIEDNSAKTEYLSREIAEEEQRTEDLKEYQDYLTSEEYIRQIARERLGLVEDGQIIFRAAE